MSKEILYLFNLCTQYLFNRLAKLLAMEMRLLKNYVTCVFIFFIRKKSLICVNGFNFWEQQDPENVHQYEN